VSAVDRASVADSCAERTLAPARTEHHPNAPDDTLTEKREERAWASCVSQRAEGSIGEWAA